MKNIEQIGRFGIFHHLLPERARSAASEPSPAATHWTRILYCDLFSHDADTGAPDPRKEDRS